MARVGLGVLAVLVLAGCGSGSQPQRRARHFPPLPQQSKLPATALGHLFAPNAVWNLPIPAGVKLDPQSDRLSTAVAEMARQATALNVYSYSVPVYVVGSHQQRVPVIPDVPNPPLHAALSSVPLPANAKPAAGTDGHLAVYQPSSDTIWEFWKLRREAGAWHTGYGGRIVDASKSPGYYVRVVRHGRPVEEPYWGATATGLSLLGGLITPDELRAGRIDHALALGLPRIRAGIRAYPAQRSDGKFGGPESVPEGARFRIDPSLDLNALGLPRPVLIIARAAQRYGMIVRDGAGAVTLQARDPINLGRNPYPKLLDGLRPYQVLQDFPWDSLELVKMQLRTGKASPN
jgi:hypothetical protein